MSKVIGRTTATPVPRSDWNQIDETKADFILNKPQLGDIAEKDIIEKNDLSSDVQASLNKADAASTLANEAKTLAEDASTLAATANTVASNALPKTGGTMTGVLTAQNNEYYLQPQVRNIVLVADGEDTPTTSNGDVIITYGTLGPSVDLINFTIDVTSYGGEEILTGSYTAEEGMTWAEWIESVYNTDGYYVNNTNVMIGDMPLTKMYVCDSDTLVLITDIIKSNYTYTLRSAELFD